MRFFFKYWCYFNFFCDATYEQVQNYIQSLVEIVNKYYDQKCLVENTILQKGAGLNIDQQENQWFFTYKKNRMHLHILWDMLLQKPPLNEMSHLSFQLKEMFQWETSDLKLEAKDNYIKGTKKKWYLSKTFSFSDFVGIKILMNNKLHLDEDITTHIMPIPGTKDYMVLFLNRQNQKKQDIKDFTTFYLKNNNDQFSIKYVLVCMTGEFYLFGIEKYIFTPVVAKK